ncbi:MAG: protein-L-isoaspartate(D-aspartate) O-methyltransferase [Desulfuromonadales bacterium]
MRENRLREMLRVIDLEYGQTAYVTGRFRAPPRILEAMARVPRDDFVPAEMKARAYDNNALPIGRGQTISQPFIVALMTDLLETEPDDVILEIGTGSGYQAAVLSQLVKQVYSLEILPELAERSARLLAEQGCANVEVLCADGTQGLPARAPFDGIIVTAAAGHIPPALPKQLRTGAHLVIPVGPPYGHQELLVVDREDEDEITTRSVLGVAFVPLTGAGWTDA